MITIKNIFAFTALAIGFVSCKHEPEPEKYNVLLIMSDDLNQNLGCYGHTLVKTPNIDNLASKGVLFHNAYTQLPLCGPSRVSMLTGMYPETTNVLINETNFRDYKPDAVTLPQLFMNNGWYVARAGKIYHYGVPGEIGTDGHDDTLSWHKRINPIGRDKWDEDQVINLTGGGLGKSISWLVADGTDEEQTDGMIAQAIIGLMAEKKNEPFFLAAGFFRPHCPYIAPKKYFEMYDIEDVQLPFVPGNDWDDIPMMALDSRLPYRGVTDTMALREAKRAYLASVSFVDAQVGNLLNALDSLGLADNTIVVFMSDHGYLLGEHFQWHKMMLFQEAVRTPLIVYHPDIKPRNYETQAIVEFVDIYPTLAGLCGLTPPDYVKGKSFEKVLHNPDTGFREYAYSIVPRALNGIDRSLPNWGMQVVGRSVNTPGYRFTMWNDEDNNLELYDKVNDPGEFTNQAGNPEFKNSVERFTEILNSR